MRGERVGGVVGRRQHGHPEGREEVADGAVHQLPIGLLVDLARRRAGEDEVDPEAAAQLQVAPHLQRIERELLERCRPCLEPIKGVRWSGDEPLVHADGPHGSPLVVVVVQPELRDGCEPAVLGQLARI